MHQATRLLLVSLALGAAGASRADYPETILSHGPLSYYRLNETQQPPQDLAANSGSVGAAGAGNYQGTLSHPELPGALASGNDGALSVNGGGAYVPANSELNPPGPFTAEFWAKPAAANTGTTLTSPFASLQISGSGRIGWIFYQAAGGWNFRIGNEAGYTGNITAGSVTAQAWQHVVGVYTADGTVILYVNGVEVGRQTEKAYTPNTSVPIGIGIRGDASFAFNGSVDEAAIYPTALSAAQVLARYSAGTNSAPATPYDAVVKSANPVGYWRLGDPDRTVFAVNAASSGAAANGRYVAGVTTAAASLRPPTLAGFEASNTGIDLDGTQGAVRLPASGVTTNRFTATAWIRPGDTQPSFAGLVFARAATLAATGLGYTEGNQIGYHWGDTASTYGYRSGLVPPAGTWSFVAMVIEPTRAIFYLHDGTSLQSATNEVSHAPLTLSAEFVLGQDPGNAARRYVGAMDEVALFAKSLSPGEVLSLYYAATANARPEILAGPEAPAGTIYGGSSFSLSVTAAGTPPLQYEWSRGGNPINGATGSTLQVDNASVADSGNYTVTVRNALGNVTSSSVAITVTPLVAPVITAAPTPASRYAGGTAQFSVTAEGTPPFAYQWLKNGTPIEGATNATLVLSKLTEAAAADYSVTVRNAVGPTTSSTARLSLVPLPAGSYSAVVMADAPVAYWRLGESTGETAADLAGGFTGAYVNGFTLGQPGAIKDVADTSVAFDGAEAKVEVPYTPELNPAQFTIEAWARVAGGEGNYRSPLTSRDDGPQRGYIFYATPDNIWQFWTGKGDSSGWDTITGTAVASGEWTHLVATYDGTTKRFYVNGALMGTSTTAFGINTAKPLRIGAGATDSVAGNFFFNGDVDEVAVYPQALSPERISIHYGTALGAGTPPTFARHPVSRAVLPGATVAFSVSASGSLPLSYQWRKGTTDLAGATNSSLSLTNVTVGDSGDYRCVVRNLAGTATSDVASLRVVSIPDKAYSEVVLGDSPVAYWRLGDVSGETAKDEKGTSPGTYVGGVLLGQPGAFEGVADGAAGFRAGNQTKVEVPWSALLNPAQFSVEVWARVTGGAGNYRSPLTSRADQPQRGYIFYATPDNIWQFWTGTGEQSGWNVISGPAVVDGAWTHLAATYDGTTKRFFVNGVEVGSNTTAFGPNDQSVLRIGAGASEDPTGNFFFEGTVDEAAVYAAPLSPEQILVHHAVGTRTAGAPTLAIKVGSAARTVTLEWAGGTLQQTDRIGGTWTDVAGGSPLTTDLTGAARFFRVRR